MIIIALMDRLSKFLFLSQEMMDVYDIEKFSGKNNPSKLRPNEQFSFPAAVPNFVNFLVICNSSLLDVILKFSNERAMNFRV